jgi:hypothetical protein
LKQNSIEIIDHYEVDKNLHIMFHNPLCYIWKNKVTHLWQKKEKILSDFRKYTDLHLSKFTNNYTRACFTCITHPFDYRNAR